MAVLRQGSLSGAARSIGLTQPTVGRHIEALEDQFGTLFFRSHSGLAPTPLADRLRVYAESLEFDVSALVREASYRESVNSGTVRITASEVVGSEVLPPILTLLNRRHPKIAIELLLSDRAENLLARQADIAVRMFEPKQEALIIKKVGDIEVSLHAHRRYLKERGRPQSIEDLKHHTLIGFDTESEFVRSLQKRMGTNLNRSQFTLRTDNGLAQISALRAGYGVGFCQTRLAEQDSELERVLPGKLSFKLPTWIVMHENLKSNLSCVAAFEALRDGLIAYVRGS